MRGPIPACRVGAGSDDLARTAQPPDVNHLETVTKAQAALAQIDLLKRRKPTNKADYQGIGVRIDRPKGFVQRGTDDTGQTWERTYKTDYGYIPRTEGGDAEELDVYMGPEPGAGFAHWVIQNKADGSFDEYKLMLGFPDRAAARKMWEEHTPKKYFGGLVTTEIGLVKSLLGVHPGAAVSADERIGKSVDDFVSRWLDDRGLLEDLAAAQAVFQAANDAVDEPTRELLVAKMTAFDEAHLAGAARGELVTTTVRRVFGTAVAKEARDARTSKEYSFDEIRDAVRAAVEAAMPEPEEGKCRYVYVVELYDDHAIVELDAGPNNRYWSVDYSFDDGAAKLTSRPREMRRTYVPVEEESEFSFGKAAGASQTVQVIKAEERGELRYTLGVVLAPDTVDSQGDTYTAETVRDAAWDYLQKARVVGVQHKEDAAGRAVLVESFIAPTDFQLGDRTIKAGTWLAGHHWPDDALWAAVKAGSITGLSIGGVARKIPLDGSRTPAPARDGAGAP